MDKYRLSVEDHLATMTSEEAAEFWSAEAVAERERHALESGE
jgi:hypothetical protein